MKDRINKISITGMLISMVGFLDSAYLTLSKVTVGEVYCADIGDCNAVNNSPYGEVFGIPIALLGAGAYLCILALFWLEDKSDFWQEYAALFIFILTLVGVLYSAFLTYVELGILHQICIYCVLSAVVILLLFLLSVIKILRIPSGE